MIILIMLNKLKFIYIYQSLEKWANKVATKTVDELKAEFSLPKREILQMIKAPFTKLFGYKIINIKDGKFNYYRQIIGDIRK